MLPGLIALPSAAQAEWTSPLQPDLLSAGTLSVLLVGLTVFATTTSLLYVRERARWQKRESEMARDLEAARGHQDRLTALLGADPQVVVSWNGRQADPVYRRR